MEWINPPEQKPNSAPETDAHEAVIRIATDGMASSSLLASIARKSALLIALDTPCEAGGATAGDSMRHVPLPFEVMPESVSASLDETGVLTLTVRKCVPDSTIPTPNQKEKKNHASQKTR
jgi:HSP20 family molecular chaperone IbpA